MIKELLTPCRVSMYYSWLSLEMYIDASITMLMSDIPCCLCDDAMIEREMILVITAYCSYDTCLLNKLVTCTRIPPPSSPSYFPSSSSFLFICLSFSYNPSEYPLLCIGDDTMIQYMCVHV